MGESARVGGGPGGSEASRVEPPSPSGSLWGGPRCRPARQQATPSGPAGHPPGRLQRGTSTGGAGGERGSPAPPWLLERSGAAASTQRAIDPSAALGIVLVPGWRRMYPGGSPDPSGQGVAGPTRAVGNCAGSPSAHPPLPGKWGKCRERVATWGAPGRGAMGGGGRGKRRKVCRGGALGVSRGEPPVRASPSEAAPGAAQRASWPRGPTP